MNNTRIYGKTQSGRSYYRAFCRKLRYYHICYVTRTLLNADGRYAKLQHPRRLPLWGLWVLTQGEYAWDHCNPRPQRKH